MDTQKQQIIDSLNKSTNILVAVNSNPSIDQLSAVIGITLLLNKLGKHTAAVFSGEVPNVMEFLDPEDTLEKNTDSLRDFIISLDKAKADKLRYKVEDDHVKIFITPYRTSISEKDLVFSQGDFNVDVVLTLGVGDQSELDKAITAHGNILHDATIMSMDNKDSQGLGSINWTKPTASSLCEMMVSLSLGIKPDGLDEQIANAFLTGIVAETSRFSNDKTSSETLDLSSKLLAAGANQQLVSSKLQPPSPQPIVPADGPPAGLQTSQEAPTNTVGITPAPLTPTETAPVDKIEADGSLKISHIPDTDLDNYEEDNKQVSNVDQIDIDSQGQIIYTDQIEESPSVAAGSELVADSLKQVSSTSNELTPTRLVMDPPSLGGTLTASGASGVYEGTTDPLSNVPQPNQILNRDKSTSSPPSKTFNELQSVVDEVAASSTQQVSATLEELEKSVDSPHVSQSANLGTLELNTDLGLDSATSASAVDVGDLDLPSVPQDQKISTQPQNDSPAPPSVPPPMMPPAL